jgi:hypothetical protein
MIHAGSGLSLVSGFTIFDPHFVYVDSAGLFRSCFFTGIYSVKDKDKSNITYFGGVHIGQDFSSTPVIFEPARVNGAVLGVASSATALKLGMVHTETSYTIHFPENSKTHVQQFAEYGFTEIDLVDPLSLPVSVAFPKILLTSSGYAFPDGVECNLAGVKAICYDEEDKLIVSGSELAWYQSMAIQVGLFDMNCMTMDLSLPDGTKYKGASMIWPKLAPKFNFSYKSIYLQVDGLEADHPFRDLLVSATYEAFGALLVSVTTVPTTSFHD